MITKQQFEMVVNLKKKREELRKVKYHLENNQYVQHHIGMFCVTHGGGRPSVSGNDVVRQNESIYIHMREFSERMRDQFVDELLREIEKIDTKIAQYVLSAD